MCIRDRLKANHQSQRFQMEDRLLKYFPVELEKCRAQVGGFEADLETRNSHPLPSEGFVGMEVLGHTFSDKEEAVSYTHLDVYKRQTSIRPVSA